MQTQLMTLPDHERKGNNVKCNITTGSFNTAVWYNNKTPFGKCPCCREKVKI